MLYELKQLARNISKGEVIITCITLVLWITIGFFINTAISNEVLKSNEVYYKAIQISEDEELFEYAMRTNAGNALVYGTATCVDSVSDERIKGNYTAIMIETEKYVRKVKYESVKDSEGNIVGQKAVYYNEWDHYSTEEIHADNISFLGKEFPYSKLELDNYRTLSLNSTNVSEEYSHKISMNYIYPEGSLSVSVGDFRYQYRTVPIQQNITILADLKDNTISNVNFSSGSVGIFYNKDINTVIEQIESNQNIPNITFTVLWIILFIVLAIIFVAQRNKWADC